MRIPLTLSNRSHWHRSWSAGWITILSLALANPAKADVGVPMLAVTWPGMLVALIPIVFIEGWILKSRLRLDTSGSLKVALISNLASTLAGIPVTWLVLAALELGITRGGTAFALSTPWRRFLAFTIQAPWLVPYESELYWMVPAATLVLLPAYFLASWVIEYKIIQILLRRAVQSIRDTPIPETPNRAVRQASFFANLASYAMLAVVTLLWLGISVTRHSRIH